MNLVCKLMASPVGKLKLVASEKGLVAILWKNDDPRRVVLDDLRDDDLHLGIPVKVNADSGGKPNGVPERR